MRLTQLLSALFTLLFVNGAEFELDNRLPTVVCRQCVQLWRMVSRDKNHVCGPNAPTCTGNACFMRQCKHCPMYQYMSGCLQLTEWQIQDLELSRRRAELMATRVGASLLCEDSSNFTTCVCNRRDKCNDIHARNPFSTYTGNLFGGIINFDAIIGNMDPRYRDLVQTRSSGHGYRKPHVRSSNGRVRSLSSTLLLLCSILHCFKMLFV
ncbi:hypothetical protein L596_002010 [Steinernema carpocapsae]|uniref:Uncharacterized protein n=1 Tax=Steinernema carpocapsae TaxID=34508 RepID=A0A4U8UN75_STECR|nr:hypothetical protein L596_002010 [Steinernema carpocapsae]